MPMSRITDAAATFCRHRVKTADVDTFQPLAATLALYRSEVKGADHSFARRLQVPGGEAGSGAGLLR